MNKNIREQLSLWLENNLINQETYDNILEFEKNDQNNSTYKSRIAKTITLVGGLFVLSGLLGTLPLIWDNLAYWAQLLFLGIVTVFLNFAGSYSEKSKDNKIFIFNSTERVSSVLYFGSLVSFVAFLIFVFNITNSLNITDLTDEILFLIISLTAMVYTAYLYLKTKFILQHGALFLNTAFVFGSLGNLLFPNLEIWSFGLFLISLSIVWGLITNSNMLQPYWLGNFIASGVFLIGLAIFIEDLLRSNQIVNIAILVIASTLIIWVSIQISEQPVFFVGSFSLLINLPRLISAILPDNIWPPLILFLIGGVLVSLGLYLNSIRTNMGFNKGE
mgnify:FL=1|jgi:Tfp pilus assembly protein PilZ|tara:strand:+ start:238 stop:1233 length:996 start_codon:yes stop_codon:yes gene_type:complete